MNLMAKSKGGQLTKNQNCPNRRIKMPSFCLGSHGLTDQGDNTEHL